jgi:predicted ATPase
MRFQLKNVGVISEADILLDNITLIAAENDSGKSTIGKALFTLINTMNYFEDEYILNVTNIIDGVYSSLNNLLQAKEKNYKNERIKEILENNYITKIELDGLKKELFLKLDDVVRNRERSNIFVDDSILKKVTLNVKKLSEYSDKDNEIKELLSLEKTLKDFLEALFKIFNETLDYNLIEKESFQKALKEEFETGIRNIFEDKEESSLILEDENSSIEIKLLNDEVVETKLPIRELRNNYNIIYIESPLIIDYLDKICDEKEIKRDDKNYILKENLMNKLEFNIVDNLLGKEKEIEKINKQIVEIISGEFTFDKQTRKYNYKKNGYNINVKNTANGIKTFGLIEMLLNNRRLNEKTILIIDEPEVHLHPNWQVKYAEILVILAMNLKVKILLNSHSPYFIDAIKIYSEKYRCNTRFYSMVDSNERTSKILLDKTNELSFIYKKLTEAYEILKQVEFSDV